MASSIRYRFTQKFPFSADVAFDWCTDFEPQDHTLMGQSNAERKVTRLSECGIILDDVFHTPEGDIAKQKLVTLYPDRYSWVSTHLTGPNKYSQFIYQIASIKGGSELEFMGFIWSMEKNCWLLRLRCLRSGCVGMTRRLGGFWLRRWLKTCVKLLCPADPNRFDIYG